MSFSFLPTAYVQKLVRNDWANGVMPRELSKLPDYVETIVHRDFMHGLSY